MNNNNSKIIFVGKGGNFLEKHDELQDLLSDGEEYIATSESDGTMKFTPKPTPPPVMVKSKQSRQQKRLVKKKVEKHLKQYFKGYHPKEKPVYHGLFGWCDIMGEIDSAGNLPLNLHAISATYVMNGEIISHKVNAKGENHLVHSVFYLFKDKKQVTNQVNSIADQLKVEVYELPEPK